MIACAHITSCYPKNQTALFIGFAAEILKDDNSQVSFAADAEVTASSSATQINTALKNAVASRAVEFGVAGLQASQIFVFGAA